MLLLDAPDAAVSGTGASGGAASSGHHRQCAAGLEDGGAKFRAAFENVILPQLQKFSPELINVSASFDAHTGIRWRRSISKRKISAGSRAN